MAFDNVGQARELQQAHQSSFGGNDAFMKELNLIDGEVLVARFAGGPEPYLFSAHGLGRVQGSGEFDKVICMTAEKGCKACVASAPRGEKRIKQASPMAAFTLYSCRPVFLVPAQRQDGSTYQKREPYRVNVYNQPIYKNPETKQVVAIQQHPYMGQFQMEEEGLKIWKGSLSPRANNCDVLLGLDNQLSRQCQCSKMVGEGAAYGPAQVQVAGYSCEKCSAPVQYDSVSKLPVTCTKCYHVARPKEHLVCTAGCGNPKRGSLSECYVQIARKGGGSDTTYTFTPRPFAPLTPQHVAVMVKPDGSLNLYDLRTIYAPSEKAIHDALVARGIQLGSTPSLSGPVPTGMPGMPGFPAMGMGVQPGAQPGVFTPPGVGAAPTGFQMPAGAPAATGGLPNMFVPSQPVQQPQPAPQQTVAQQIPPPVQQGAPVQAQPGVFIPQTFNPGGSPAPQPAPQPQLAPVTVAAAPVVFNPQAAAQKVGFGSL